MKPVILILGALVLLLLTGVIPVGGGVHAPAVYYSPVMILLLALLSILSVRCCIRFFRGRARPPGAPQRTARRAIQPLGFLLVHLGIVVILAGAFIGYVAGTKGVLQLSLMPQQPVGQLLTQDGDTVSFGFDVAAEDFQVQFYPPMYQLFRKLPPEEAVPGRMPYKQAGKFSADGQGACIVEGFGPVSNLWNEARQEWTQRKMLNDGSFLGIAGQTPSFFGVTLLIDGKKLPVSINHPAGCKGWRFYLMSYDQMAQRYVQLSARHDPGRNAVIAGIWIVMIGTFVLCFRRQAGSLRYVSQASSLPLENDGGAA